MILVPRFRGVHVPEGLAAREYLRHEARREWDELRRRGVRDPLLEAELSRHLAPAVAGTTFVDLTDPATNLTTPSVTIPSGAIVFGGIKWEDTARTPTLSGGGVSSWSYPTGVNAGGPRHRTGYGVSAGATGTLTAAYGSSTNFCELIVCWLTGCDTTTPLDTSTTSTGSGTPQTIGALSNSVADAVYLFFLAEYGGTNFSSWLIGGVAATENRDGTTAGLGSLVVSSTASRSGSVAATGGPEYTASMLIFKGAAATGIVEDAGDWRRQRTRQGSRVVTVYA